MHRPYRAPGTNPSPKSVTLKSPPAQVALFEIWLVPRHRSRADLFTHVLLGTASANLSGIEEGTHLSCLVRPSIGSCALAGQLQVGFCLGKHPCIAPLGLPSLIRQGISKFERGALEVAAIPEAAPELLGELLGGGGGGEEASRAPPIAPPSGRVHVSLSVTRVVMPLAELSRAGTGDQYFVRILLPGVHGGVPFDSPPFPPPCSETWRGSSPSSALADVAVEVCAQCVLGDDTPADCALADLKAEVQLRRMVASCTQLGVEQAEELNREGLVSGNSHSSFLAGSVFIPMGR